MSLPTMAELQKTVREIMSRKEAAAYLGVAESTMANWVTSRKFHIPYFRVGRKVKYFRRDLDAFIESGRVE